MKKKLVALLGIVLLMVLLLGSFGKAASVPFKIAAKTGTVDTGAVESAEEADDAGIQTGGTGDIVRFGESVTIPKGKNIRSLAVIGGSATVDGDVEEAVVVVGGSATISGTIGKELNVVGGDVTLKKTAHIKKDLVNVGGQVTKEDGARIEGNEIFGRVPFFGGVKLPSEVMNWFWFFQGMVVLIGMMALGALCVALLPEHTGRLASYAGSEPLKSLGVGFLGILAIPLVFIGLILTIIGIPVALMFGLLLPVVFLFGYIGAALLIGGRITGLVGGSTDSPILGVVVGILLLGLVGFVPYLGGIIKFAAVILGAGAILITKFGTGRPWRRQKAAQLGPDQAGGQNA